MWLGWLGWLSRGFGARSTTGTSRFNSFPFQKVAGVILFKLLGSKMVLRVADDLTLHLLILRPVFEIDL